MLIGLMGYFNHHSNEQYNFI